MLAATIFEIAHTLRYATIMLLLPLHGNETKRAKHVMLLQSEARKRSASRHLHLWALFCSLHGLLLTCRCYCVHTGLALIANFVARPAQQCAIVLWKEEGEMCECECVA